MDILRIVASFMVIMLHVSASQWFSVDVNSAAWKIFNLYDSAVRSCVPLFFMISGMFFLGKEKMVPLSKLIKSNILNLIVLYAFWSLLYAVDTVGIAVLIHSPGALSDFFAAAVNGKYHLWFIPALSMVYLLSPVLYGFSRYKEGRYISYACLLFFTFAVLIPTIKLCIGDSEYILTLLKKFNYELVGYSGYFLFGYYLSKKNFSKIRTPLLVAALIAVIAVATLIGQIHAAGCSAPSFCTREKVSKGR